MPQASKLHTTPEPQRAEGAAPDAALIALGYEFNAVATLFRGLVNGGASPFIEETLEELTGIAERIADRSADTLEGLLVKARVVRWMHGDDWLDDEPAVPLDERLAFGIVRDLLAGLEPDQRGRMPK